MNRRQGTAVFYRLFFYALFDSILLSTPLPAPEALAIDTEGQIRLGTQLFFDPRLSRDDSMSCASCHIPDLWFTDGRTLAVGIHGTPLPRHTPTLMDVAENSVFFWDGRAPTLEKQILMVLENPGEMNMDLNQLTEKLNRVPGYSDQFERIYRSPVTIRGLTRAIAAFERTLVSRKAPFDRYQAGHTDAMTASAVRGMEIFQKKGRCAFCHKGFAFTNSEFHNIGVPSRNSNAGGGKNGDMDVGRFSVTQREEDRGAFKTPTLRNIAETAPYMHNGVFNTLEEVVNFYDDGGGKNSRLDTLIKPLHLNDREKSDLVEFLKSLTGEKPEIQPPPLP
jgi:cytochrome c peroxidase